MELHTIHTYFLVCQGYELHKLVKYFWDVYIGVVGSSSRRKFWDRRHRWRPLGYKEQGELRESLSNEVKLGRRV